MKLRTHDECWIPSAGFPDGEIRRTSSEFGISAIGKTGDLVGGGTRWNHDDAHENERQNPGFRAMAWAVFSDG
jgi:hypothetical protein